MPESRSNTGDADGRTERDNTGKFQPGKSGNPGGRPSIPDDVKAAFGRLTKLAVQALEEIVTDADHPHREKAAEYIVNRELGKPRESVDLSNPDGSLRAKVITVRYVKPGDVKPLEPSEAP